MTLFHYLKKFSVAFRSIVFSKKRICDKIFHFQKTILPLDDFSPEKVNSLAPKTLWPALLGHGVETNWAQEVFLVYVPTPPVACTFKNMLCVQMMTNKVMIK